MLLRRYMEHLRDQNWTAVWLDLVVVVVGIFLGLQVTEWSHGRADRQQEKIHLERLEHALDANVDQLEQAIDLQSALIENHARVAVLLKKNHWTETEDQYVRDNIVKITFWRAIDFDLGVITSLTSSGEINLIQNTDVQEAAFRILASKATLDSQLDYWRSWYLDWFSGFVSAIGVEIDTDRLDYGETDVRRLRGVEKVAENILVTAPRDQLTSKVVRDTYTVAFPLRGNYLAHLRLFLKQIQETKELVAGERARLDA